MPIKTKITVCFLDIIELDNVLKLFKHLEIYNYIQ